MVIVRVYVYCKSATKFLLFKQLVYIGCRVLMAAQDDQAAVSVASKVRHVVQVDDSPRSRNDDGIRPNWDQAGSRPGAPQELQMRLALPDCGEEVTNHEGHLGMVVETPVVGSQYVLRPLIEHAPRRVEIRRHGSRSDHWHPHQDGVRFGVPEIF